MSSVVLSYIGLGCIAYIIGSIPFGLIVGKLKNLNLREVGSGNIGATNVYRNIGKGYGVLVFLLDSAKGYFVVELALRTTEIPIIHIIIAGITISGHALSCFAGFRGGKGVATALGIMVALSPDVSIILFALGLIIIFMVRIVSVATLAGCLLTPFLLYILKYPKAYYISFIFIAIGIIYLHRENIKRLVKGQENQI